MRRLLSLVAASVAVLSLVLGVVYTAGALGKASGGSAMLDVAACTQPCWHNIRPDQTTLDQARGIVRNAPGLTITSYSSTTLCWDIFAEPAWHGCTRQRATRATNTIEDMALYLPDGALRLGDAIALFGTPIAARLCVFNGYDNHFVAAIVSYKQIELVAYDSRQPFVSRIDPNLSVFQVWYLTADSERYRADSPHWRGFINIPYRSCG